jgi:hypothetical protein
LGGVGWVLGTTALAPAAYLTVLAVASARAGGSVPERLRFATAVAVIHYAWGSGFVRGLVQGARDAVDTSRVRVVDPVPASQVRLFPEAQLAVEPELVGATDR